MIVSEKVREQYKKYCRTSWEKCLDDESLLNKKIIRSVDLGRVKLGDEDGLHIIRYNQLDFVLNGSKIIEMYVNRFDPTVEVFEAVKKHYNEVHNIESKEMPLERKILNKVHKINKMMQNINNMENNLEREHHALDKLRALDDEQKQMDLYA